MLQPKFPAELLSAEFFNSAHLLVPFRLTFNELFSFDVFFFEHGNRTVLGRRMRRK